MLIPAIRFKIKDFVKVSHSRLYQNEPIAQEQGGDPFLAVLQMAQGGVRGRVLINV